MGSAVYRYDPNRMLANALSQQKAQQGSVGVVQVQSQSLQVSTQFPMQPIGNSNAQQLVTVTLPTEDPADSEFVDVPLDMADTSPFVIDSDGIYIFMTSWAQAQYVHTGTKYANGFGYLGWSVRGDPTNRATSILDVPSMLIYDSNIPGITQANQTSVFEMPAGSWTVCPIAIGNQGNLSVRVCSFTVYLLGHY